MPEQRKIKPREQQTVGFLRTNARIPSQHIADELGCSPSYVTKLIDKLVADRVITGFTAVLNQDRLYQGTVVFAKIRIKKQTKHDPDTFIRRLQQHQEVLEVYAVLDSADYLVKILTRSNDEYWSFITDVLCNIEEFDHVESIVAMKSLLRRDPADWRAFYPTVAETPQAGTAGAADDG